MLGICKYTHIFFYVCIYKYIQYICSFIFPFAPFFSSFLKIENLNKHNVLERGCKIESFSVEENVVTSCTSRTPV